MRDGEKIVKKSFTYYIKRTLTYESFKKIPQIVQQFKNISKIKKCMKIV